MNKSMSNKAVYRTAPATPGLLNIEASSFQLQETFLLNYQSSCLGL